MKKYISIVVAAVVSGLIAGFIVAAVVGGNQPQSVRTGTRYPNGLSTDSTSPSSGQVRTTTLTVTGASTLSGTLSVAGAATLDELTQGGSILATSTTNTSETFVQADLLTYSIIDLTPNTGNTTYTFGATSTWTSLIPSAGDMRTWIFRNATTSAINATLAAGTGMDLQESDGQNVVIGQNNFAIVDCYRKTDTDVVCFVDETIPAD